MASKGITERWWIRSWRTSAWSTESIVVLESLDLGYRLDAISQEVFKNLDAAGLLYMDWNLLELCIQVVTLHQDLGPLSLVLIILILHWWSGNLHELWHRWLHLLHLHWLFQFQIIEIFVLDFLVLLRRLFFFLIFDFVVFLLLLNFMLFGTCHAWIIIAWITSQKPLLWSWSTLHSNLGATSIASVTREWSNTSNLDTHLMTWWTLIFLFVFGKILHLRIFFLILQCLRVLIWVLWSAI